MKTVLLSIQPKWCELIASGEKTVEVRKTKPKIEAPFKCYVYETKGRTDMPTFIDEEGHLIYQGRGQVIGEFVCDEIETITSRGIDNNFDYCYESLNVFGNDDIETEIKIIKSSCIKQEELNKYANGKGRLYCWHISDLMIYSKPKELCEFRKIGALEYNDWLYGEYDGVCVYEAYLKRFTLTRPPQSWCYVEEIKK